VTRPPAPRQTRRPRPQASAPLRAAKQGHQGKPATSVRRTDAEQEEAAGAVEPYRDAVLYDWEYRRRRDDVAFYRMLAAERGGPVLDLGCGTGRLLIPLAADGFDVVGIDLSASMLRRAHDRRGRAEARRERDAERAGPAHRRAGSPPRPGPALGTTLLLRADLRALPVRGTFPLVVMAFHTIQHLVADDDLLGVLRTIRQLLGSDGWFAFDVFAPRATWLARPAGQRFGATIFRHPTTKQRLEYSFTHRLDRKRRALHITFRYRAMPEEGARGGSAARGARRHTTVRLCHRQLTPGEVEALLARAGLKLIGRWGGFHDEPLGDGSGSEQHVYLARPAR
jgi:SAM-dependent methyltransferase